MELSPTSEPPTKRPTLSSDAIVTTISLVGSPIDDSTNCIGDSKIINHLNAHILPTLYDILRCIEKDPQDAYQRQKESAECSSKIIELKTKFDAAREQIKQLPGIDYNKEEQLERLESLRKQLILKQELIRKYKDKQL